MIDCDYYGYLVTIGSRIVYNDVMSLNYSLVTNITCKGGEDSVAAQLVVASIAMDTP